MRATRLMILVPAFACAALAQRMESSPTLDYEFFKTRVQPIFLAQRPEHARCISCHTSARTRFLIQPLPAGRTTWTEDESRKNFESTLRVVVPGSDRSRLLMHPLAETAGGDFYHSGGKHWISQHDPEWLTIKAWVMGERVSTPELHTRIIQTNSAGDNVHLIDPAANKVVGIIRGIEAGHGAGSSPDGSRIYISDEGGSTLDIVDARSLGILKKIPLSGHPNNMAVSKDGSRVYVGIIQEPGGVDVIDTVSMQRVKTVPTQGTIHNVYVTPDGRYVVAGSIAGETINVIDAKTDEPAWKLKMDLGVRPMAFSANPDGSTRWIFTQLTGLNGFAVVDFATQKEIRRISNPDLPPGKMIVPEGSDPSHGMAVTADGKTLVVCSRLNNYLYSYSVPDLKLIGGAELGGKGAGWVTLTPDGKTAYVANPVTNDVSVVDVASMKETMRIPVGFVPKRNATARLQ
ncbi:MAG TPA: cytochrome D1 domain-containing protein [Blastocatellia bacterium]|nr:cytochrome D1 domain-containing protein [Blastocatellia bacterium]